MREIAKRVSLRLDSTEYALLKQLSMDTGLKMEPVIRRLIVGAELRPVRQMNWQSCCGSYPAWP